MFRKLIFLVDFDGNGCGKCQGHGSRSHPKIITSITVDFQPENLKLMIDENVPQIEFSGWKLMEMVVENVRALVYSLIRKLSHRSPLIFNQKT